MFRFSGFRVLGLEGFRGLGFRGWGCGNLVLGDRDLQ